MKHHHTQNMEYLHHPPRLHCSASQSTAPAALASATAGLAVSHYRMDFLEFHSNGFIEYVLFWIQLFFFCQHCIFEIHQSSEGINSLFLSIDTHYSIIYINHILLVYPLMDLYFAPSVWQVFGIMLYAHLCTNAFV